VSFGQGEKPIFIAIQQVKTDCVEIKKASDCSKIRCFFMS